MVVQDVSISVRRGEAVGLLGPNGAGKTTVFYMIIGLVKPDKGVDRTGRPRRHQAADVPARAARRRLPAAGSVDLPRPQCRGQHPRGAGGQRARPGGARSGAGIRCWRSSTSRGCAGRRRSRLSGGERRRCEIARALAGKPSFMLLDEPFAGIDPIAVGDIQDLVRHLEGTRHRRPDHRSQRARDAGADRSRLHHPQRPRPDRRAARRRSSPIPTCAGFISARTSGCRKPASLVFAEAVGDERGERLQRRLRVQAGRRRR